MQKLMILMVTVIILSAFQKQPTLKGTWEYRGGKYNNKPSPAPKGYAEQRKYGDKKFEAFLLEKGEKTKQYEAGNYTLKGDTCFETQTYSLQPSKLKGITIHYQYTIRHDTLILKAKLPAGTIVEDYWKRVK